MFSKFTLHYSVIIQLTLTLFLVSEVTYAQKMYYLPSKEYYDRAVLVYQNKDRVVVKGLFILDNKVEFTKNGEFVSSSLEEIKSIKVKKRPHGNHLLNAVGGSGLLSSVVFLGSDSNVATMVLASLFLGTATVMIQSLTQYKTYEVHDSYKAENKRAMKVVNF